MFCQDYRTEVCYYFSLAGLRCCYQLTGCYSNLHTATADPTADLQLSATCTADPTQQPLHHQLEIVHYLCTACNSVFHCYACTAGCQSAIEYNCTAESQCAIEYNCATGGQSAVKYASTGGSQGALEYSCTQTTPTSGQRKVLQETKGKMLHYLISNFKCKI